MLSLGLNILPPLADSLWRRQADHGKQFIVNSPRVPWTADHRLWPLRGGGNFRRRRIRRTLPGFQVQPPGRWHTRPGDHPLARHFAAERSAGTVRHEHRLVSDAGGVVYIPLPKRKIDGKSLVKVIRSAEAKSPHDNFVWQSGDSQQSPQWAVREGNWKLVHNPIGDKLFGDNKGEEKLYLFNIARDISG